MQHDQRAAPPAETSAPTAQGAEACRRPRSRDGPVALHRGGLRQGRAPVRRRRQGRRADDGNRPDRRRCARRVPPAAIRPPHPGGRRQPEARHPVRRTGAGHGAGRWRQRHGPSRHGARGGRGRRAGARNGRRLDRRAPLEPRRLGRALCRRCRSSTAWSASTAAVASANHMAPWGGSESLLGTNPLAIGIPCGDAPPVVLDMATTVVSYGTVKTYALHGRAMPPDWMVSRVDGQPLTDSRRSRRGRAPADRRSQGQRAGAGARPARRAAQPAPPSAAT